MGEKPKTPSIRALQELRSEMISRVKKLHNDSSYGDTSGTPNVETVKHFEKKREEILTKISKEVEAWAIKNYMAYGLEVVPVCRRGDKKGDTNLDIQLKVHSFPELKKEQAAAVAAWNAYEEDRKKIDEYYYSALKAIASKESLPEPPTFTEREVRKP